MLGAQLATVREWPAIHLSGLEGATATLTTVCQGYSAYYLGTLRYQRTIKNAGTIERRERSAYFPRADFHVQLLDRSGFKQRQIDLEWLQLTSVVADSAHVSMLQANDAAGSCGGEMQEYASWNLSYALPEPRPSL